MFLALIFEKVAKFRKVIHNRLAQCHKNSEGAEEAEEGSEQNFGELSAPILAPPPPFPPPT